ncbi:MAG: tail fiber domain-containing protein, partial [Bacteroidota bacterium]
VIDQIQPVSFRYNEDAPFQTDQTQVGVVAQELEKVAPYMVHQTTHNDMKDVRYVDNQAYTFLLINAVKELKNNNEQMQQLLDKQQLEISNLKKMVEGKKKKKSQLKTRKIDSE